MLSEITSPRLRPIAAFVALAFCGIPAVASAVPTITLAAAYGLGGAASSNALGQGTLTPANTTFPSPTGADFYLNQNAGSYFSNNVFFHTYGFTGGTTNFGARASGANIFSGQTSSLYSTTFTNNGATSVDLMFSFFVDAGQVTLYGTGSGSADLRLQVRRDGNVVSQGDTSITESNAGVYSCTENDLGALASWASCGTPTSSSALGTGGNYNIDLGVVGVGQSINIDYDIVATVAGNYYGGGPTASVASGYCYGGYGAANPGGPQGQCVYFNAIARSGDPFNDGTGGSPANFTLLATPLAVSGSVPEPVPLALFAAASAGWWRFGRRRRADVGRR